MFLMPINDINGNPLTQHLNFPNDNETVTNIEFGAGRNYYGKKEFPNCYLTDLTNPNLLHFSQYVDYEFENCHFLDANCDFYEYNFARTFENIILCNPYNYGFSGFGSAKKFFDRAGTLLNEEGEIHIIGHSLNKWSCKDSFEEYLENDIEDYKSKYNFKLHSYESLNREHSINATYRFYRTELKDLTVPNERLVIKKCKDGE